MSYKTEVKIKGVPRRKPGALNPYPIQPIIISVTVKEQDGYRAVNGLNLPEDMKSKLNDYQLLLMKQWAERELNP